jgi:hypothetical protein
MQLSAEAACQLAIRRINEKNPREAEQLCRQILQGYTKHVNARLLLGIALHEQTHFDPAIAILGDLHDERPNDIEVMSYLGSALSRSGKVDQAIELLERAVALAPDAPKPHWFLNEAIQLKLLAVAWAQGGKVEQKLPFMGDRVVLLRCDRATRESLRPMGLHGGCQFDPSDGANQWLNILLASKDLTQSRVAAWLQWLRDEAAMLGAVATVWSPSLPESFAQIVRRIAGEDLIEVSGETHAEIFAKLSNHAIPPPPTANKIFAIVSIRNGGVELLPHWLDHYSQLGCDELLIGVFSDVNPSVRAELDRCARHWSFRTFPQTWHGAVESEQYGQRRTACRKAGALPDTWIIHTDLDEFHEYPAPLRQIADAAAEKNIRVITGNLIDRVAEDGAFPPILPEPKLKEQFPIECKLTERISGGQIDKVMMARFSVPVTVGHHLPFIERAAPPRGNPVDYRVAHFKWHSETLSRLKWAMQRPNAHAVWKAESQLLLQWLDKNGGRINLDDPALEARRRAVCS